MVYSSMIVHEENKNRVKLIIIDFYLYEALNNQLEA